MSEPFVQLPHRLLVDLYDAPLAIGVYALVGRRFALSREAVPLSAADLTRYDPSLSYGAAVRALSRLVERGWLIPLREQGHKTCYTPSWGTIRQHPRPWQMGTPRNGRPPHITTYHLPSELLDTYLGQLTPHPSQKGLIARFLTAPLLDLASVGSYALCMAELAGPTEALVSAGLVHDGRAVPLAGRCQVLAAASQRAECDAAAPQLTDRGLRELGVRPAAPYPDSAQLLFFAPREVIGPLIGPLIARGITEGAEVERGFDQATSVRSADRQSGQVDPCNESKPSTGCTSTCRSGGRVVPPIPETEGAALLSAKGVRPEVVLELADQPLDRIQAAFADAEAREGVRDTAAWAVSLLRAQRDYGWTIPERRERDRRAELLASFARIEEENRRTVERIMAGRAEPLPMPEPQKSDRELLIEALTLRIGKRYAGLLDRLSFEASERRLTIWCPPNDVGMVEMLVLPHIRPVFDELNLELPPERIVLARGRGRSNNGETTRFSGGFASP